MQRILILGCCGSGKSTFARQLNAILSTELIHLDQHYWQPNWTEPDKKEWAINSKNLSDLPNWIIDGNYTATLNERIKRADTIIYLDIATWRCMWRITKRTINYWHKERPDMPPGSKERFDLQFFHYVAIFNLIKRKKIIKLMEEHSESKNIYFLSNNSEINSFLNSVVQNY